MKRPLFFAAVLSFFLAAFTMNTGMVSAAEKDDISKQQSKAVKETQDAIDNLRNAIRNYEQTQKMTGDDEHLREAVNNAKSALESAEKSMEHAKLFTPGAAGAGRGMERQQQQKMPSGGTTGGTTGGR